MVVCMDIVAANVAITRADKHLNKRTTLLGVRLIGLVHSYFHAISLP